MQLAKRLWVPVQVQPIFLLFECWPMFNLGIAYGAKVGLKLRLSHGIPRENERAKYCSKHDFLRKGKNQIFDALVNSISVKQ